MDNIKIKCGETLKLVKNEIKIIRTSSQVKRVLYF